MKVGFIGAGRMGFTLGRHFAEKGKDALTVSGYYSRNPDSARAAAEFTDTKYYEDIENLVAEADALFVTVPDGQIAVMAERLDGLGSAVEGKIICHTSGALSSQVFSGMHHHVYGYSIHPIYAVHSKTASYKHFSDSFITMEGHQRYLGFWSDVFTALGHSVKVIAPEDKVKYHSAAVFASNLVVGLYHTGMKLLGECGFTGEEARAALNPLFTNNADNLAAEGSVSALTGPVARCDVDTVKKHLAVLPDDAREIYRCVSGVLVSIAEEKALIQNDTSADYRMLKYVLENC